MKLARVTKLLNASLVAASVCSAPMAFAQSAAPAPGSPKPAAYDCSGLEGSPLASCRSLNAANGTSAPGDVQTASPSANHDCADMTGASLETCRGLNGQAVAPAAATGAGYQGVGGYLGDTSNIAGTQANPAVAGAPAATNSSAGANPASLSNGSGTTTPSTGSSPTALSGGSGKTQPSSGTAPTTSVSGGNAGTRGGAGK